jgi:glutathione S-transferase
VAATLYAVPASHPCAAVEKALQLKGLEYRRIDIPPVTHKLVQKALFGRGTVPGLVLDGRKLVGSREIMRALDEAVPEPRLLPADDRARKPVRIAEEWGDEVLQPLARRAIWVALGRSPASLASYGSDAKLPIPDAVTRATAPLITAAERRINRGTELNLRADLASLDHHLARVERWVEHGVVLGPQPNAADLQIGAGLALLLTIGDIAERFGSRGAFDLARRWFPDYPGHVPAGVLPAEWFRGRTAAG